MLNVDLVHPRQFRCLSVALSLPPIGGGLGRGLHAIPHANEKRATKAVAAHDGAVGRLTGNATIELIGRLQVALAFSIEQVAGLEEDGQTVLETLLTAEVEGEEVTFPFVRVEVGRDKYKARACVGSSELTIPTVVGILI